MSFKKGDKVISVMDGKDTDQTGIVVNITEDSVEVCPLDFFFHI